MKKTKLIVNLEGPRGVGKSTQIGMLKLALLEQGLKVSTNTSSDTPEEKIANSIKELTNGSDIVLNEGSFLRTLAEDFVNGMAQDKVLEKNRRLIELNETTRYSYKVINLIMLSEKIDELTQRISKFNKLTDSNVSLPDIKKETDIVSQIVGFERSMVTLNADTKIVYIDLEYSIIEVRDILKEIISAFL